jgi:hypothetical protein
MEQPLTASLSHPVPTSKSILMKSAVISSAGLIFVQMARWPLVSLLTPFLEPFIELGLSLAVLIVAIVALIHGFRWQRSEGLKGWSPFGICLVAALIVILGPFNAIYLKANFKLLQRHRTIVAQQILAGRTGTLVRSGGRGDLFSLDFHDRWLSESGEIMVDHRNGKTFILFFTFRGILDRFSGYVYSPTGDPPAKDQFLGDGIEIDHIAPNWFWYAS